MINGRDITYMLPCKAGSVYINVTSECLNHCLFCIRRDGPLFFGYDLSLKGSNPEPHDIISSLKENLAWESVREVVFCGMGEPMLRYDCVVESCKSIRTNRETNVRLRVDTSGLFWASTKRLDILDCIDILSVSLNAENEKKYKEICRPKIENAYDILMDFIRAVKLAECDRKKRGIRFPEVRLSLVDTSEDEFIPASGRLVYPNGGFPIPDFEECAKIAATFGWPLVIKRLFRDSRDECWNNRSFEEFLARGNSLDRCNNCTHRH